MDAAIIVTYRCNARCRMCKTWQFPTKVAEEFTPELLRKLPDGLGRVNLTGGEPLLRKDLGEIVDVLAPKAHRLEISTNGYFTDRLIEIGRRHPELTIRISLEGLQEVNDDVRGMKNGFRRAMRSFYGLRDAGVKDLGFAVTIQDDNADDLLNLYRMVDDLEAEFAQAVPHNSYYFHTDDNEIRDVGQGAGRDPRPHDRVPALAQAQAVVPRLSEPRPRGLRRRRSSAPRVHRRQRHLLPRSLGRGVPLQRARHEHGQPARDPSSTSSGAAPRPRRYGRQVRACDRRCWMTGTAVPAMKRNLPGVAWWVARNKVRVALGRPVDLGD